MLFLCHYTVYIWCLKVDVGLLLICTLTHTRTPIYILHTYIRKKLHSTSFQMTSKGSSGNCLGYVLSRHVLCPGQTTPWEHSGSIEGNIDNRKGEQRWIALTPYQTLRHIICSPCILTLLGAGWWLSFQPQILLTAFTFAYRTNISLVQNIAHCSVSSAQIWTTCCFNGMNRSRTED